ncbi:hypothetical protein [Streptomyces klenkii]|uniref:hypothetical protein n=1 Tax=Streptomyces klenkii TaxID=1420899 RepID=UPI00341ACEC5
MPHPIQHVVLRHVTTKNNRSDGRSTEKTIYRAAAPGAIGDLAREWIHQEAKRFDMDGMQVHCGSLIWAFAIIDAISDHTEVAGAPGTLVLTVSAREAQVATSWELDLNAVQKERASAPAPFTDALAAAILGTGGLAARHKKANGLATLRGWRLQRGEMSPLPGHAMRDAALVDPATGRWLGPEPGVAYMDAFPVSL